VIKKPEQLAKKLGLQFNNPQYFVRALTHRSAGPKNNERLEFLGDAVLGFVIADKLYEKFPQASEGVLSRLRANLVNQTVLADIARENNLGDYLLLGSGELKSGGFRRDSILSDALEAIIGAIVKDQNIEAAQRWVLEIFGQRIAELSLTNWQKDAKTRLQEILQAKRMDLPEYTLVAKSGLAHAQIFEVECRSALLTEVCLGRGDSRKKAEQDAAEKMLQKLSRLEKSA